MNLGHETHHQSVQHTPRVLSSVFAFLWWHATNQKRNRRVMDPRCTALLILLHLSGCLIGDWTIADFTTKAGSREIQPVTAAVGRGILPGDAC